MECYFTSQSIESESTKHNAVISFIIPEMNIVFRAQFAGDEKECEYAALLSLLEFIEINPQIFKNKAVEIFSDSFEVVHQVNNEMYCNADLEPYRKMAVLFRKKVPYVLRFVPASDNPAQNGLHSA